MALTKDDVAAAAGSVEDPGLRRDLASLGAVRKAASCEGYVSLTVALSSRDERAKAQVREAIDRAVRVKAETAGEIIKKVEVEFVDASGPVRGGASAPGNPSGTPSGATPVRAAVATEQAGTPQEHAQGLPGVRHVIAVGAGKGGVGKSTIAVNLAVALARGGKAVGLMDGDIYGPSAPTLLGLSALDAQSHGNMLIPFFVHGVKAMTLGKLVDPDKPLIWRGPMAHGAFKQLVMQTQWGELDYLIIDLPPGTGDVPLTMAQLMSLSGAVIVCTPQKVAQDDAVRAAGMFRQLGIPLLGVVENMSYFVGDDGKEYDLFGKGGAEKMAARLGLPFLGGVPISTALRKHSDSGEPLKNFDGGAANAGVKEAFEAVARNVESQAALATMKNEWGRPKLSIT